MKTRSTFFISLVLASLAALAPFAIDTYLPAFPSLAKALGGTNLELQQSLTAYLFPYAIMTLWHGAISDSIGRLSTLRWGLGVFAVASLGCAFSTNVETLWFFRAIQGISGGAGNVVARAMVRDLFEGVTAQRVMAQVQMIFGLAPAVAPMIGGVLLGIHWQAIFIFLFLYSSLTLIFSQIYLPETVPKEKRIVLSAKNVLSSYKSVFGDIEFLKLTIAIGANFAGFFVYVLASPVFLLEHLHLNQNQFGFMFVPTVCGMVTGSYLARHSAGQYEPYKVVRFGYGWMTLAVVSNLSICLLFKPNPFLNIAPIAFYNIGMAMVLPILSIAALDRIPRLRGTAASGQAFIQMLLSTVSAGIVIPLIWHHISGLALGMFGYLILGLFAVSRSSIWKKPS